MEIRPATLDEVRNAQASGNILKPVRLALCMESCITEVEMHDNFFATLERGFTPINEYLGAYSGTCSVVGSAPSIRQTHKELTGDVIAINSAISYLLDQGVVPKFGVLWDGTEVVEKFARPHPDITYLVASRCHPKVFERLRDCKVIVWHAGGDHNIVEVMQREDVVKKMGIPQPLVLGGSAGVTRTMYLATALGYTDLHIYGADSSYSEDGATHVTGSVVPEKDFTISIGDNTEGAPATWFRTTPEWCQQVNEYRSIYALFTLGGRIKVSVHGGGLMGEMHSRIAAQKEFLGEEKFNANIISQDKLQAEVNEMASGIDVKSNPLQENENVANACQ